LWVREFLIQCKKVQLSGINAQIAHFVYRN
jgi:hypothetical protein